jgi:hypothetical protein
MSALYLMVLFADPDPEVHPTCKKEWLEKAVDWKGTYNVSDEVRLQLRSWMEQHNFYDKRVL